MGYLTPKKPWIRLFVEEYWHLVLYRRIMEYELHKNLNVPRPYLRSLRPTPSSLRGPCCNFHVVLFCSLILEGNVQTGEWDLSYKLRPASPNTPRTAFEGWRERRDRQDTAGRGATSPSSLLHRSSSMTLHLHITYTSLTHDLNMTFSVCVVSYNICTNVKCHFALRTPSSIVCSSSVAALVALGLSRFNIEYSTFNIECFESCKWCRFRFSKSYLIVSIFLSVFSIHQYDDRKVSFASTYLVSRVFASTVYVLLLSIWVNAAFCLLSGMRFALLQSPTLSIFECTRFILN